jgi:hypothetical protein
MSCALGRDGTGRPGPDELWVRFDAAVEQLNRAGAGDSLAEIVAAYAAVAHAAAALADALEAAGESRSPTTAVLLIDSPRPNGPLRSFPFHAGGGVSDRLAALSLLPPKRALAFAGATLAARPERASAEGRLTRPLV